jgi:hypothetical protein
MYDATATLGSLKCDKEMISRVKTWCYRALCTAYICALVWLLCFSRFAVAKYQTRQLPSGTYCIGACPGGGNPSGTGDLILPLGLFELVGVVYMVKGVFKGDSGMMRRTIILCLVFVGLYVWWFQSRSL